MNSQSCRSQIRRTASAPDCRGGPVSSDSGSDSRLRLGRIHFLLLVVGVFAIGCQSRVAVLDLQGQPVTPLVEPPQVARTLIFVRTDCPIANRYAPEMQRIVHEFGSQGVEFALVYPTKSESAEQIRRHQQDYALNVVAYRDPNHALVAAVGATITPEAVVFDSDNRMVYRGRINDRFVDFGQTRPTATTHDLRDVLNQLVAKERLSFVSTKAVGCYIESQMAPD